MRRILFLLAISVVGAAIVCAGVFAYQALIPQPNPPPPAVAHTSFVPPKVLPLPDVDTLAKRLPYGQAEYARLRDEALADFAAIHPGEHPWNTEAQETLKLMAYLHVWDDFYGENLWSIARGHFYKLEQEVPDQLWLSFGDIDVYRDRHSLNDATATRINVCADHLGQEVCPAAFRLWDYRTAMTNMIVCKTDPALKPPRARACRRFPISRKRRSTVIAS